MGRYDLNLSEDSFWHLTFEQFHALRERHTEAMDFMEYCAALSGWAQFVVHRKDDNFSLSPADLMLRQKSRLAQNEPKAPLAPPAPGQPAPPPGMRWKQAGERPPSKEKIDPALFEPPRKADPWQMPVN